ncbi:discoidin domain-containing protein [Actinoplanes sp. RD1]|uniref:discoidin domain-containing protein n=1 Tax=Actinoplanes sp. RD1 TaxID=3064538 RepID=UPI002741FB63|nr:discoidin domain-containing protein [Actinoplanes sp. RD1]
MNRRLATLGLALTGMLGAFVMTPGPASAAEVVVSQGKATTSSSDEWSGTPASAATDGNTGTRWSSAFTNPAEWLKVDLGSTTAVTRVALNWEAAYATAFTVQFSTDNQTFTNATPTLSGNAGAQSITVSGNARYVRLNLTSKALPAYGYSLWEFQVFANSGGGTGGGTLLSYGKRGVASSEQNDVNCNPCTADKAFDRDPATRWATSSTTGWVDPGWIYVDLGATATISRVELQWDPAYATTYKIQVSPDASSWSDIYSTTTGKGFKEVLNVSGTGRYVRMYGTARVGPYGYSLYDFDVYGTGGSPTAPPAQPADPTFPATRLVWHDEFDTGAGTKPSTANWYSDFGVPQNGEVQYYTDTFNNATMDGAGHLVIEARKEASNGRDYTSGRLNTSKSFNFQYGRVEARIKVPKGNGLWPAFWMMGSDFLTGRPWPYNGEIDIMEILGRNTNEGYSTLHAPQYNGAGGYGQKYTAPVDLSLDYHTYAAEWDSKGIRFFLDGTQVFNAAKSTVEATRGPWIFDHKFYVILNLAVGGDFPGPIDATTPFPSRMLVDYVRVYQ